MYAKNDVFVCVHMNMDGCMCIYVCASVCYYINIYAIHMHICSNINEKRVHKFKKEQGREHVWESLEGWREEGNYVIGGKQK